LRLKLEDYLSQEFKANQSNIGGPHLEGRKGGRERGRKEAGGVAQ
jgi:hypothetical protein